MDHIAWADHIANWLSDRLNAARAEGYVIGLSGGVDSATAAGLAVRAIGAEHVLGALLPCHSRPDDARLGHLVADTFGIATRTIDLAPAYDALIAALPPTDHPLAAPNAKPRLRMTALYYLAQANGYLVLGSGNRSELMVGYFTKYGDGGVDLLPLGDLYKTQVWELASVVGVPDEVVERTPSGGLWPGQTDEGELGITYQALDRVLKAIEAGETDCIDPETLDKVRRMIRSAWHKRAMPPICQFPFGDAEESEDVR